MLLTKFSDEIPLAFDGQEENVSIDEVLAPHDHGGDHQAHGHGLLWFEDVNAVWNVQILKICRKISPQII